MDVYLVNESSTLPDLDPTHPGGDAWRLAWSLNWYAQYHLGRSGWRSDVRVIFAPGGAKARIPAGGSVLHALDTSDVAGALGYHDEDGNEVAYGKFFVATAIQDSQQPSEVAAHELAELIADPHVNLTALTGDSSRLYAVEVGDPVQGTGYDLFAPQGKTSGVTVANFALPPYFDPNTTREKVDFRGVLKAPFTIAPQGYMSYIDTAKFAAGWQQQFGQDRTAPAVPDRDDRLGRR